MDIIKYGRVQKSNFDYYARADRSRRDEHEQFQYLRTRGVRNGLGYQAGLDLQATIRTQSLQEKGDALVRTLKQQPQPVELYLPATATARRRAAFDLHTALEDAQRSPGQGEQTLRRKGYRIEAVTGSAERPRVMLTDSMGSPLLSVPSAVLPVKELDAPAPQKQKNYYALSGNVRLAADQLPPLSQVLTLPPDAEDRLVARQLVEGQVKNGQAALEAELAKEGLRLEARNDTYGKVYEVVRMGEEANDPSVKKNAAPVYQLSAFEASQLDRAQQARLVQLRLQDPVAFASEQIAAAADGRTAAQALARVGLSPVDAPLSAAERTAIEQVTQRYDQPSQVARHLKAAGLRLYYTGDGRLPSSGPTAGGRSGRRGGHPPSAGRPLPGSRDCAPRI